MSTRALIRSARERHGVSQAALARRARTTPRQIRRIEQDEISPSVRTLERLLGVLGERLELHAVPSAEDNRSPAELRADYRDLTPSERIAETAALSRTLTSIGAQRTQP